jgi:hypothetical protein
MQTEEEMALKRSEITRRRKNQSAQRAEQDKLETINRLLKKQAGKRKIGAQDDDEGGAGAGGDDKNGGRVEAGGRRSNRYRTPASYLNVRYTTRGTTLSIPEVSLGDVPLWMQETIPAVSGSSREKDGGENEVIVHRAIEVLEVPVVPLKEPTYPAPRGLCAVVNCEQTWKYRGTKSKKVACGLAHLKVVEAEA